MSNFHHAISYLRKKKGLKQAEIAEKVGISPATWSDYERGKTQPNFDVLRKISEFFKVRADDLISDRSIDAHLFDFRFDGKKQVNAHPNAHPNAHLNTVQEPETAYSRMPSIVTVDQAGRDNIVLVNSRARAGYLAGYEDPEWIETLPSYSLPGLNHGTYRMFEVTGQSMVPTFHESDLLIGRFVENFNEIRDNRIYIVVSRRDGVVVKRVVNRVHREGKLILNSDNQRHRGEYPPIVLNPEDVAEIWYAVSYISRQMREPGEVYNRLIDLESRLTLLEHTRKNDPPKLNGN